MSEAIGTREFAEKFGVTPATVSKWCREGKIPNCNQDGKGSPWHIPKDAVPGNAACTRSPVFVL